MFRKILFSTSIAISTLLVVVASAQNTPFYKTNDQSNQSNSAPQIKWLGVSVENLSSALRSQLGSKIKTRFGVLIRGVQPNSPAEKAGLQNHDILMSVDGKAVESANQLYQLVQQSSTAKSVSLDIIRHGEYKTLKTTLETRTASNNVPTTPFNNPYSAFNHPFFNSQPNWNQPFFQQPFAQGWSGFSMPPFPSIPNNLSGNSSSWSQSESLSVKTLKNGNIQVKLKTKDKDNNEKNYVFEGSRETVINQIRQKKDIEQNHKDQLLGAVQGNNIQLFKNGFNHFFNHSHPAVPRFPSANPWQFPRQNQPRQQRSIPGNGTFY